MKFRKELLQKNFHPKLLSLKDYHHLGYQKAFERNGCGEIDGGRV